MLSVSTLETQLRNLLDGSVATFAGYPATKADAITNWGNAYNTYALSAQDVSGDPVVTTNLAGFTSALTSGLVDVGTVTTAADAFEAAFVAYWTGGTFATAIPGVGTATCPNVGGNLVFSAEVTSLVSAVTPNILKNLLLTEFAILSSDAATKAASLASAFHTATTTAVFVTIAGTDTTPPPTGPLPVTNTCTIF